ncbi:hypothetical protein GCM10007979_29260 [Nocardioides albus]|uniref:Uncharacterized protein n=1 Tax=Nocardioides albus TaxID=1841 RepID=A0A7W5F9H8_9ACTN|nr:hypothetical protein [Nocardioides albus]GGU28574.1 hypothetical protein GCM10007979_29260 [Nocardioides albus]
MRSGLYELVIAGRPGTSGHVQVPAAGGMAVRGELTLRVQGRRVNRMVPSGSRSCVYPGAWARR